MGINERRMREREQRRTDILAAAWLVATELGWAAFSIEKAADRAEIGRATLYSYFDSLESLVSSMADEALEWLSGHLATHVDLPGALDAPLRFAQTRPAAFALLFQDIIDPRPAFAKSNLSRQRAEAGEIIGALRRLAAGASSSLPSDARAADAFLAAISMAGVVVPELRDHTPLRRQWQDFCLALGFKASPPRNE